MRHFLFQSMEKIKTSFSWFQYTVRGWNRFFPKMIIENHDHEVTLSILPPSTWIKKEQIQANISDSDFIDFCSLLSNQSNRFLQNKNTEIVIDEPLRTYLKSYGLSKTLSENEWTAFLEMLFSQVKIQKWKDKYFNPNVLDGATWTVEYKLGKRIREISGYHDHPDCWQEFIAFLEEMTSFSYLPIRKSVR